MDKLLNFLFFWSNLPALFFVMISSIVLPLNNEDPVTLFRILTIQSLKKNSFTWYIKQPLN